MEWRARRSLWPQVRAEGLLALIGSGQSKKKQRQVCVLRLTRGAASQKATKESNKSVCAACAIFKIARQLQRAAVIDEVTRPARAQFMFDRLKSSQRNYL